MEKNVQKLSLMFFEYVFSCIDNVNCTIYNLHRTTAYFGIFGCIYHRNNLRTGSDVMFVKPNIGANVATLRWTGMQPE